MFVFYLFYLFLCVFLVCVTLSYLDAKANSHHRAMHSMNGNLAHRPMNIDEALAAVNGPMHVNVNAAANHRRPVNQPDPEGRQRGVNRRQNRAQRAFQARERRREEAARLAAQQVANAIDAMPPDFPPPALPGAVAIPFDGFPNINPIDAVVAPIPNARAIPAPPIEYGVRDRAYELATSEDDFRNHLYTLVEEQTIYFHPEPARFTTLWQKIVDKLHNVDNSLPIHHFLDRAQDNPHHLRTFIPSLHTTWNEYVFNREFNFVYAVLVTIICHPSVYYYVYALAIECFAAYCLWCSPEQAVVDNLTPIYNQVFFASNNELNPDETIHFFSKHGYTHFQECRVSTVGLFELARRHSGQTLNKHSVKMFRNTLAKLTCKKWNLEDDDGRRERESEIPIPIVDQPGLDQNQWLNLHTALYFYQTELVKEYITNKASVSSGFIPERY